MPPPTTYITFGDSTSNHWSLNPAAYVIEVTSVVTNTELRFKCFIRSGSLSILCTDILLDKGWLRSPEWLTTNRSIGCLSILQHIQRWTPWRTLSSPPNITKRVEGGLFSSLRLVLHAACRRGYFFINKTWRWTYFPWPEVRFKLEVRLARLASRSPVTIFWSASGLVTKSIFISGNFTMI